MVDAKLVDAVDLGPIGDRAWWEVPLPSCPKCGGDFVWYEAGYVPGTRKCMGKPIDDEITSILDARLPQPPYANVREDDHRIATLLTKYRNLCSNEDVYEVDKALLHILYPYRVKRYDEQGGCGEIYQVVVENGHAILYRNSWEDGIMNFRQLTSAEKESFARNGAAYKKYLSEDADTVKILDEIFGVGKYSALNTIERRAIWRAGFEVGGPSCIFATKSSNDCLHWRALDPEGIDPTTSEFWRSDSRKDVTENDSYYYTLGSSMRCRKKVN